MALRPRWGMALGVLLACALAPALRAAPDATNPERLSYGRFERLALYRPQGTAKSAVLLLSGDQGWDQNAAAEALELVHHGALVIGIDYPAFAKNLEADGADCVFPDGDLENLSHFVQAYYRLPSYLPPLLVGQGSSASLAYATLAQAPANTFAGALTVGFCPATSLRKPLCKGSGVEYAKPSAGAAARFLPARELDNPWVTLQAQHDPMCTPNSVADFIAKMPGAALVTLPDARWMPAFLAAFDTLIARAGSRSAPAAPVALGELPVVEVPAKPGLAATDSFAIILSGDGGWAGLDKEVAQALSEHGIPVAGLDSLRYFWSARTPEGIAADIDRMVRYYLAHFGKKRVLLIGYSQGADVLPFALNKLPAATRAEIGLAVLMGMSEHALFEFHVSSWISNDNSGPATLPEVDRIAGIPVLCIYGEGDDDSLCPKLNPAKVKVVKLPGGHHFDGDYARLAREILAAVPP
jgi:type IV secretory pathway VirJ component